MKLCIGLFGTCGGSKWRDPFMKAYDERGFVYYNPQVDNWEPWMAKEEAEHLAEDAIILFPVTSETYGLGSLAETGYSILQALRLDRRREFIAMIDDHLDDTLTDEALRKESMRGRKLITSHLAKINMSNVHVVMSLESMLELSIKLYRAYEILEKADCA
jgi:hypothetical protein